MRRSVIEEQNSILLRNQHAFRVAADVVTDAFMTFEEIEAIAVIGSVAKPLWKEIPRFREFRRADVAVWHECKDLDLAVWLSKLDRLGELRRVRDLALRDAFAAGTGPGVASHQAEVFLFEPGSDRYIGRLCNFNACPKGKRDCAVPGCGEIPFNKMIAGFKPRADLLASAPHATLYRRGQGRLMSALDLPPPEAEGTSRVF
ncbi:MAG: hypothetical protein AB1586_29750 [Pseudomonadota bacterium]|jgi:hypothetical protein